MQKKAILFSAGDYLSTPTYSVNNLSGVKYDVEAMENRLIQIGFDVLKKENAVMADYLPALHSIADNAPSDAIHIIYFSGHGGHYQGKNYIAPVDYCPRLVVSKNIVDAAIDIQDIISVFKDKGILILILDACRDNIGPVKGYYSEMTSSRNVYIAYGTMFQAASKGVKNGISWFTEAICDEILTPNIDIDTLFKRVRNNIYSKHYIQIPLSVNALLDDVCLHSVNSYDSKDMLIYNFIEKYGDKYNDKHGYFRGEDMLFIDASQYFGIGLLDAMWRYRKVSNKIYKDAGGNPPELSEAEYKILSLKNLPLGEKYFLCDKNHTWYYNGRQIRMGEIPPLPASMQPELPELGKELIVNFDAHKQDNIIAISTNLPDGTEIFIYHDQMKMSKKYTVCNSTITIEDAANITKVVIDEAVAFPSDDKVKDLLGVKCKNLTGKYISFHPIHGNVINCCFDF